MTSPMCASRRFTAISAKRRILRPRSPNLPARTSRRRSRPGAGSFCSRRVFTEIVAILHELIDVLPLRARLQKGRVNLFWHAVVRVSCATDVGDVQFTFGLVIRDVFDGG